MKHIAFPDIGQYRNLIRNVASHAQYVGKDANGDAIYDPLKPLPTLEFEGTVKLHGTNAAIVFDFKTNEFWCQSRENIITVDNDNAGFARTYMPKFKELYSLFFNIALPTKLAFDFNHALDEYFVISEELYFSKERAVDTSILSSPILIFGEWCGKGIQKGVGISELPKMFVVFAVYADGNWISRDKVAKIKKPEIGIYNIYDYPSYQISIDFAHPELSQNKLGELTLAIENECPVAKAFGASGVGEGIVWKCITPGWEDGKFWMKVKGEKHSVSKVKTLAPVDIEKVKGQQEFVANVVTEARCLQSISKLKEAGKPLDRTSLGEYLRWIFNDVVKEETDTAKANNIDLEKLGGPISVAAKTWFFKNEASFPI